MRLTILCSAVLLAGCASRAEQSAALDVWGDCIQQSVRRLDDGKTDPVSLAYGIAPTCSHLYQQFSHAMESGTITERSQAHMRALTKENEIKLVTSAVLAHRSRTRLGPRAP